MKQKGLNRDKCFSRDQTQRKKEKLEGTGNEAEIKVLENEICQEDKVIMTSKANPSDLNKAFIKGEMSGSVDSSTDFTNNKNFEFEELKRKQADDKIDHNQSNLPRVTSNMSKDSTNLGRNLIDFTKVR